MRPPLSEATTAALDTYLDELARWSEHLNLTTIPREQMWSRHVEEALELLEVAAPAQASRVVDIGSGGGVPGMVMAIVRPDLRVTMLEADTRKSGFLIHVAGTLRLHGVEVEAIRAEDAGRRAASREKFDLAMSRAAAPPEVLCELALPLLRVGGNLFALVADAAATLTSCAAAAAACGGGAPQAPVPGVLRVEKVAPTPVEYPRRSGVPGRRPIS
jgi:16S rRNA (guanine527-N7)-methyltransferase